MGVGNGPPNVRTPGPVVRSKRRWVVGVPDRKVGRQADISSMSSTAHTSKHVYK